MSKIPIFITIKTESYRCPNKNQVLLPITLEYINQNYSDYDVYILTNSNKFDHYKDQYPFIKEIWNEYNFNIKLNNELLSIWKFIKDKEYIKYFIHLPVTQPCRNNSLIEYINNLIQSNIFNDYDLITSYVRIPKRNIFELNKTGENKFNFQIPNIERKGSLCQTSYMCDGAIYGISRDFLEKCINSNNINYSFWNNGKIKFIENYAPFMDIDTPYDLKIYFEFFNMPKKIFEDKNKHNENTGWICPKCGKAVNPNYKVCPFCSTQSTDENLTPGEIMICG